MLCVVSLLFLLVGSAYAAPRPVPLWKKTQRGYRGNSLRPSQTLNEWDFLMSDNCAFIFVMWPDGNVQINKNVGGLPRWQWGAHIRSPNGDCDVAEWCKPYADNPSLAMGNHFIYEASGKVAVYHETRLIWEFGRGNDGRSGLPVELVLQNDGNLCSFADDQAGPRWCLDHVAVVRDASLIPQNACFSCHSVEITHMKLGTPRETSQDVNVLSLTQNNCGVGEKTIKRTIKHSQATETSESYSFGASLSDTFRGDIETSVGVTSSAGVEIGAFGSASLEVTASVTASAGFSKTRSSSSNQALATKTNKFQEETLEIPIFVPANKIVTFSVTETWGIADVDWTAIGTCFDAEGRKIEEAPMSGVFKASAFRNLRFDCDRCDNGFSSADTGCQEMPGLPSPVSPPAGAPPAGSGSTGNDGSCGKAFETCGGTGHSGPTCCVAGLVCEKQGEFFSMCVVDGGRRRVGVESVESMEQSSSSPSPLTIVVLSSVALVLMVGAVSLGRRKIASYSAIDDKLPLMI